MHSHTFMLIKLHLQKFQLDSVLKQLKRMLAVCAGFLAHVVSTIAKHGDLKVAMTKVQFD